ncbi:hypothetical protein CDIK_0196 [Cucumispora dikerogammari]|nr:hypothetical protein CDIK_0196 [Cucumispora dikerogammari]
MSEKKALKNEIKSHKKRLSKQIIFEAINSNSLLDISIKEIKNTYPLHFNYLKTVGFKTLEDLKICNRLEKNTFPQNIYFMKLFDERIAFFEANKLKEKKDFRKSLMYPKLCDLHDENFLKKALESIETKVIYRTKTDDKR